MSTSVIKTLRSALGRGVFEPGADGYAAATSPHNSSFPQRPCAVVRAGTAEQIARTVAVAAEAGLRVAVQATGHGAGRPVDGDHVLVDTSSLTAVSVDATTRTATVAAGATWPAVQRAAHPHGLLGLSGTSPTVGVAGYVFSGGVGWLVRRYGLASASLRSVGFVDGEGRLRRAADDADDSWDREALWAFRGGGPVGVATDLQIDLHPVVDLWTGYLLWPADALRAVAGAWSEAVSTATPAVSSTLSLLKLPPQGPFPEALLGTTVVHLSYASIEGRAALEAVSEPMRTAAAPLVDTTGPGDLDTLSGIHLDPAVAVPARGTGRWLAVGAPEVLLAAFDAAGIGDPDGLNMIEIRHTDAAAGAVDGACTAVPGPFLVHAVGAAADDDARGDVDAVLHRVEEAVGPADAGRSAPAFRDGRPDVADALSPADLHRFRAAREALDPAGTLWFSRDLRAGEPA